MVQLDVALVGVAVGVSVISGVLVGLGGVADGVDCSGVVDGVGVGTPFTWIGATGNVNTPVALMESRS